jgi:cobalamin biosynthesis Mg chelatase CobN
LSALPTLAVALTIGAGVASTVSACGSGGSGAANQQVAQAATQAKAALATKTAQADATKNATETQSQPGSATTHTKTVTAAGQPKTETRTATATATATAPSHSGQLTHQSTGVQIALNSTTADESSGGVPWWGWLLITLGVAALAIGTFIFGRRRGNADSGRQETTDARAAGRPTGRSSD